MNHFRAIRAMHGNIAREWLSASGHNSAQAQRQILAELADDELAADCAFVWGLEDRDEGRSDFNRDMLTAAFADLRRRFGA